MGRRSLSGVVGLGIRRVVGRLTGRTPGRMIVAICGIAVAIAVLLVITGVAVGLTNTTTVDSTDVDYWVVPDEGKAGSTPLAFEGARIGGVHETTAELQRDGRIEYATPVAIQPLQLESTSEQAYVLALGVQPSGQTQSVLGIDITSLDSSYPYYANGSYDGEWTGELLASPAAATQLNVTGGEGLTGGEGDREFTVVGVADEEVTVGVGDIPVVVVHLAELQSITGMRDGDQADQILVVTDDSSVGDDLAELYPGTEVVTRSGLTEIDPTPSSMPFAMAVAAGLTALGIGVAFITTMMGLELNASRQSIAVLSAVGYSRSSIGLLLLVETVTVAFLGGIVGVFLGLAGIVGVNAGLADVVGLPPVAVFDPVLVGYGLVTAVVVGLLATGYPLYIAWRTTILEELTR